MVDNDRYYSRFGDGADELTVPELFERAIAAFNALDSGRRDRFLRSAQWYDAALGMWSTHYGAGLGALSVGDRDPRLGSASRRPVSDVREGSESQPDREIQGIR